MTTCRFFFDLMIGSFLFEKRPFVLLVLGQALFSPVEATPKRRAVPTSR
jgi:hypothetical protein